MPQAWHPDYKSLNDRLKAGHRADILRLNNWREHAEHDAMSRNTGGKQQDLNKYF